MLKTFLQDALRREPPKEWPTYDGKLLPREEYLSASEVAQCLRKSYFDKHPDPNSPARGFETNGYAERGHAIESYWVAKLRRSNFEFRFIGDDQVSFYDPDLGISGTPDGLVRLPSGEWVLFDFKSIDPRKNRSNLPDRKHRYQVIQNIFLVNRCLPEYNIKRAFIFYIDASDIWDVIDYEIAYDEAVMQEVLDRADKLWTVEDGNDLDPEGIRNDDCDRCPHHARCSSFVRLSKQLEVAKVGAVGFLEEDPPELSVEEVESVLRYLSLKSEVKAMEKSIDALEINVKTALRRAGGSLLTEDSEINYREYPGKETVDRAAMEQDGIDVSAYLKVGKPYCTIRTRKRKT